MIDYTPPYPITILDIQCWRIGQPIELFDESIIEDSGDIILRIECEDGVFYVVIKDEK